jgi:hypothetical protein
MAVLYILQCVELTKAALSLARSTFRLSYFNGFQDLEQLPATAGLCVSRVWLQHFRCIALISESPWLPSVEGGRVLHSRQFAFYRQPS